ncbi:MAG: DUF3592 domain-containing protein [Gemmatimonadetes bacterium]|nr:DUF3592 domain-containing protein [Gemmatimonadota bacterium]MBK7785778.1 DUF3592 domain-containing protein [Gemmatimonadota bacterium]MBK9067101.1 DUF3592 domain-containing protein [Gemmatimonadota bacterium]
MRLTQPSALAPDQWLGLGLAIPLGGLVGAGLALAHRRALDTPRLAKAVLVGLTLMSVVATCDGYRSVRAARALLAQVDSTTGLVVSTQPQDHNQITVRFRVATDSFLVQSGAPGLAGDVAPGDLVVVYYDRSKPRHAMFERPDPEFVHILSALPVIWILGTIWLLGVGGSIFGASWRTKGLPAAT